MTISTTTNKLQYNGNGSTTTFAFPYKFFAKTNINVILTNVSTGIDTAQTEGIDFTITGTVDGNGIYQSGGSIVFITAPASGYRVTITRILPITQENDYVPNDPFPAESHEQGLDRLTLICQQVNDGVDRALKVPTTSTVTNLQLPNPVANKFIKWNGTANALENGDAFTGTLAEASSLSVTPSGDLTALNAQAIIDELETLRGRMAQAIEADSGISSQVGNDLKVLYRYTADRLYTFSRCEFDKTRYTAIEFRRNSGEAGRTNFQTYRHCSVLNCRRTFLQKTIASATVSGTWTDDTITTGDITAVSLAGYMNEFISRKSSTYTNYIEQSVAIGEDGYINVLLLGTAGSPTSVLISVDGTQIANINAYRASSDFLKFRYYVGKGTKTIRVTHNDNSGGKTLYVCSLNAVEPALADPTGDYNKMTFYRDNGHYIYNNNGQLVPHSGVIGANDFAISNYALGYYVGSFHGSEVNTVVPKIYMDGVLIDDDGTTVSLANDAFAIGTNVLVEQKSLVASVLNVTSQMIVNGNSRLEKIYTLDGTINTAQAFLGMHCTYYNFTEVLYPKLLTGLSGVDVWTSLGYGKTVIQKNPTTQQVVINEMPTYIKHTNIRDGLAVRYDSSAQYAKLYSGYIDGELVNDAINNLTFRLVSIYK